MTFGCPIYVRTNSLSAWEEMCTGLDKHYAEVDPEPGAAFDDSLLFEDNTLLDDPLVVFTRNKPEDARGFVVPCPPASHEYLVRWEIDVVASSPREACEKVWRENFNRTAPSPGDACVFGVIAKAGTGDRMVMIDLSDSEEE